MGYHYRALEKLCLKRMSVKDEDLELLADSFPYFKELVLVCCDGFGTSGLAVIANNCRDLQSYLSHLSLFLAPESKKFYILVDNRPWLKDLGPRSAHLWQLMVTKAPNYTSPDYRNIDLGSSSKCNNKMTMRPPIANTTQERAMNRTPEKRQRVPSAYNQFIKEEIQRIKANNPDISHREAFSTAAKNMKRKYRIATPSTLSDKRRNLSGLLLEGRQRTSPKIDKDDINILTKAQVDLELARMRSMNPQEAAVAAAQAVAEAEAEYNFCCGTEVVGVQLIVVFQYYV